MAFITSLRIKNFFSIKDEVTIDFKASPYNIENNPDRLFEFNGEFYNKIISLYGANASGKTTVLKAISTLSKVIFNEQSDYFYSSFKNKFSNLEVASELEVSFVLNIENKLEEFNYKLVFKSKKYENIGIENEELTHIKEDKNEVLFNREKEQVVNVDGNIIESIFKKLSEKKSLIQDFFIFEKTKKLEGIRSLFLMINVSSNIDPLSTRLSATITDEQNIADMLDKRYSEFENYELEKFFVSFFNSIGHDIVQIKSNFKEEDGKEREFLGIELYHDINQQVPLEFSFESDGTQMLMKILLDIFLSKMMKAPLIIDELDSIIHPMLVPIIINLLIENDIQIIYSTHNIYNMQFLQNDEIFLIEKNSEHETKIESVKDNPNIKGYENLLTHYENGDLGGIPKVEDLITKIF
ncbi:MAG: Unknown protein [uncultured Sulfurovum sp.]|uniref:ATPase AAA-type core domain-containing protein n=1 Tax=uncultured Sulfurovum sp. TaxID=269237 RepID=A0A6S6RSQ8_9BACT|nr:MAG: Unknown protein [uncultured Sulfurovum sp.]